MKILFLTIGEFSNINQHGTYTDLLRMFKDKGHEVVVVCSNEKKYGQKTSISFDRNITVLRVQIGNITKTNLIEKGISTLTIGNKFGKAIHEYLYDNKFDLILYSTPPITLADLIKKVKKQTEASTYLLLKDIFPQNAIDLGILDKRGLKGQIYKYFRKKEKMLYCNSDKIGCMSQANVNYVLNQNPYISKEKIEVCPNTIDIIENESKERNVICKEFALPEEKILLLYGGNFGRPQNVDYIIEVVKKARIYDDFHFVMCGSGTEFYKIEELKEEPNLSVINGLSYDKYVTLVNSCDIGLLFLDYRFEIPNFPSRLLDYMNYQLPILAATDSNTDVGRVIEQGNFGWWCESKTTDSYINVLQQILQCYRKNTEYLIQKGKNAKAYLVEEYATEKAYNIIMKHYSK